MRRSHFPIGLFLAFILVGLCSGCGGDGESSGPERLKVAVIPKGTTHVFWKSVERGAKKAGKDLDVEILWKGPLKENDRAQQIQVVQQFVSQKVSGIVLAPLDFKALVNPVKAASAAGIPVVIYDSSLEGVAGTDFVSFVATDNKAAGSIGGNRAKELLPTGGKIVVLRYAVGSASTTNREEGFLAAVKSAGNLDVISDNQYAGATAGEAKTMALNMIEQVRKSDLVFCPNESSTMGMLLALRQEGLAGKVKFIGFDSSPPLVKALADGHIDALVVQDPEGMGEKAVRAVVSHLKGESPDPVVDTGATLVTRENMNDPDVKRLIE